MALVPLSRKNLRIHAFAIVPDLQPEASLPITDFDFNPPCVSVPECVAHRLDRDPVYLVPGERGDIPRCVVHMDSETGLIWAGMFGNEFFSHRADRAAKIVDDWKCAQPLHGIASFGDGLPGRLDDALEL